MYNFTISVVYIVRVPGIYAYATFIGKGIYIKVCDVLYELDIKLKLSYRLLT